MKLNRIFRTLAIAIILSLLMVAIPATPVCAASIELNPEKGPPGTVVEITGTGFTAATYLVLRFGGAHLDYYQLYGSDTTLTHTFTVPQKHSRVLSHTFRSRKLLLRCIAFAE